MTSPPCGVLGAAICLGAIFLPSAFLVVGLLPFWRDIRRYRPARSAFPGINAAVVGLLLAALYDPVWTSGITGERDVALAAFLLLALWKVPPWLVVLFTALSGWTLGLLPGG